MSEVRQPAWRKIVAKCRDKIILKHKKYGNSWVNTSSYAYWMERLQGEVNELRKASGKNPDIVAQQECVDVINICAMIYTIIEDNYPSEAGPPDGTLGGVLRKTNKLELPGWDDK